MTSCCPCRILRCCKRHERIESVGGLRPDAPRVSCARPCPIASDTPHLPMSGLPDRRWSHGSSPSRSARENCGSEACRPMGRPVGPAHRKHHSEPCFNQRSRNRAEPACPPTPAVDQHDDRAASPSPHGQILLLTPDGEPLSVCGESLLGRSRLVPWRTAEDGLGPPGSYTGATEQTVRKAYGAPERRCGLQVEPPGTKGAGEPVFRSMLEPATGGAKGHNPCMAEFDSPDLFFGAVSPAASWSKPSSQALLRRRGSAGHDHAGANHAARPGAKARSDLSPMGSCRAALDRARARLPLCLGARHRQDHLRRGPSLRPEPEEKFRWFAYAELESRWWADLEHVAACSGRRPASKRCSSSTSGCHAPAGGLPR